MRITRGLSRVGALGLLAGLVMSGCARRAAPSEGARTPSDSMAGMAKGGDAKHANEVTFTAAQIQHGGVRWVPVVMGAVPLWTNALDGSGALPGQVVPNEDRTARLGAPAPGRVLGVRVSPGDRVHIGQILVTLQSPEAGMAQSDLAKAAAAVTSKRAQATYAASARGRAERLLALKAIPRQDYEHAIADDELARAEVTQAEAEFGRATSTAAALGAAGAMGGELAVRAPIAGVVLDRTAVPGTVVAAGTPLVVITDVSSLWVTLNAPEAASGSLLIGQSVRFVVPALPTDTFTARLTAVGAGLDAETRTLFARGVVANPAGRLKPAMLASVFLPPPRAPRVKTRSGALAADVVVLPADAVQLVDNVTVVFIATPDARGGAHFVARRVEAGSRAGGEVPITHGIATGELVVIAGAFAVKAELQKAAIHKEM